MTDKLRTLFRVGTKTVLKNTLKIVFCDEGPLNLVIYDVFKFCEICH